MIDRLQPELLEPLRKHFLNDNYRQLYPEFGFYLFWFGAAEVYITSILVTILKFYDFEKLEFITRGMDARVKCERLRQAAKAYSPLGKNIKTSLGVFEQECIPLRNSISHSWPHFNEDTKTIYFASFGRTPKEAKDGVLAFPFGTRSIHIDDLFSQAMWINSFTGDLSNLWQCAIDGKPLEVIDPKSRLPQGVLLETQKPDDPAKPDKPTQNSPE